MRRVLLDTHVFVWALAARDRLPPSAWKVLNDPTLEFRLSVASAWELAIKSGQGKLILPGGVDAFIADGCRLTGVSLLGIDLAHLAALAGLPNHHRDPFDRLLIATALAESMDLLSYDAAMSAYEVGRVG